MVNVKSVQIQLSHISLAQLQNIDRLLRSAWYFRAHVGLERKK